MGYATLVGLAVAALALAACGADSPTEPTTSSGVTGWVDLGPQCPVEIADQPCEEEHPAGVIVTVSRPIPGEAYVAGELVARGTTGADRRFRIAVAPGDYVVTAEAGMSCELMDAHVTREAFVHVTVPCDTGIR